MQKSGGNVRSAGAGLPWCLVPCSEDTWTHPHPRLEPQRHEHPHLSLCLPHPQSHVAFAILVLINICRITWSAILYVQQLTQSQEEEGKRWPGRRKENTFDLQSLRSYNQRCFTRWERVVNWARGRHTGWHRTTLSSCQLARPWWWLSIVGFFAARSTMALIQSVTARTIPQGRLLTE